MREEQSSKKPQQHHIPCYARQSQVLKQKKKATPSQNKATPSQPKSNHVIQIYTPTRSKPDHPSQSHVRPSHMQSRQAREKPCHHNQSQAIPAPRQTIVDRERKTFGLSMRGFDVNTRPPAADNN
ncbi:hypothetical protein Pmani_039681 [Petrolisthes manimaculis]|uniref:Uncharacterized protein n=1 Tax=Petrolisthes manimaculis TaxID=1843537 RepID=A0AAE1NDH7_9EUCA|nr:hypothetical protein Pmani_039681 [Petrolisthes manimaculis]